MEKTRGGVELRVQRNVLVLAFAAACLAGGCSDPEKDRLKATTQATYDPQTGKLTRLTADINKNGVIDTWTYMDGTKPLRSEIDENEDGKIDKWEYVDDAGTIVRLDEDVNRDGKVDKWSTYGPRGVLQTLSFDEDSDGRPDRRLTYGEGGRLLTIESEPDGRGGYRKRVAIDG